MRTLSIIIPVYQSAGILPELMARLDAVLPAIASAYEVIMVCDGSADGSWGRIQELSRKYPYLKGLDLVRNYGQQNALLVGIREACHELIVTMDDDLQHPPEEIPKLLARLEEGYDVVYGTPSHLHHNLFRNTSSRLTKQAMKHAIGYGHADTLSAFRAFRTHLRDAFAQYRDKFISIDILLTWGTHRFTHVVVTHDERKAGASGYNFRKLLLYATNMITSFSSIPLQIASFMGFLFMMLGGAVFIYVMVHYALYGAVVPGFTFLSAMIAIFSGVQLFSLGIIGEYLSRIHFRSMGQPYAVIRERTDGE